MREGGRRERRREGERGTDIGREGYREGGQANYTRYLGYIGH